MRAHRKLPAQPGNMCSHWWVIFVCVCVSRYTLPGIHGLNFVLQNSLGGGGVASLRSDPQVTHTHLLCLCSVPPIKVFFFLTTSLEFAANLKLTRASTHSRAQNVSICTLAINQRLGSERRHIKESHVFCFNFLPPPLSFPFRSLARAKHLVRCCWT